MLRIAIALTTAALGLAALPAIASAQDEERVFFPKNCERNAFMPKKIQVFCADGGLLIAGIKYDSYGTKRATGSGTATVNTCEPNCAAGNVEKHDARIRLTRVRQCGDVPQFTRIRVTFAETPTGLESRIVRQRVQCADAPR